MRCTFCRPSDGVTRADGKSNRAFFKSNTELYLSRVIIIGGKVVIILEFSEKLKELRHARRVTQAELARAIFVSRSSVAKWENGLGLPGESSLASLVEYFGVRKDYFDTEEPEAVIVSKNRIIHRSRNLAVIPICLLILAALFAGILYAAGFRMTSGSAVDPYYHQFPTIWTADYNFYTNDRVAPRSVIAVKKCGPFFRTAEGSYLDIINPDGDKIGVLKYYEGKDSLYCFIFVNGYITEMGHREDGTAYAAVNYPYRTSSILLHGTTVELDFYCYFQTEKPLGDIAIKGEPMLLVPQAS